MIWVKRMIFCNVAAPGEGASADRINCQRQPTTKFAIKTTTSVAAIRARLAWLMSSAACPRSNRIASARISPAVTKMRALVTRILTMAVTPGYRWSGINAGSAGPSQCLRANAIIAPAAERCRSKSPGNRGPQSRQRPVDDPRIG